MRPLVASITLALVASTCGCQAGSNGGSTSSSSAASAPTASKPTSGNRSTTGSGTGAGTGSSTGTPSTPTPGTSPSTGTGTTSNPNEGAGSLTGTPGTTYYVAPTGADTNAGTQALPFRQIRAAVAVVKPGDAVLVADGSYLGFDVNAVSGAAGQPIAIQAQGQNALVTATTDRPDNRDNIFITFSTYIIIDGLHTSNAPRSGMRIDNSPNITVRNVVSGNNATWGIFTDFSNSTLLQANECFASGTQHGIYVSNSSLDPVVRGNKLHDNAGCGLHMNGDVSQGGVGLITGALVEQNVIWNNGTQGGSGINGDGVQSSTIRNNLLYGNHASGISLYQTDAAAGPSNDFVYDNTIDQASDGRSCLNISNTTGKITVRDNIFFDEDSGKYAIDYHTQADAQNVDSDYNVLGGAANVSNDDGNTLFSLAQWQTQGYEAHSLTATLAALFVDQQSANYHLAAGSPAVGAGLALSSVTTDLDGKTRSSGTPDIGCYGQ